MKRMIESKEVPFESTLPLFQSVPPPAKRRITESNSTRHLRNGFNLIEAKVKDDISFNLGLSKIYFGRALALFEDGAHERSIESFRLAIELSPRQKFLHIGLGRLLFDMKRFNEAEESFRTACAIGMNCENSRFWHARTLFELQQYEEARNAFAQLEKNSNSCFWLGRTLFEMGDYNAAAQLLCHSLSYGSAPDCNRAHTHFFYGRALLKVGERNDGCNELKIAIQLDESICGKIELLEILGGAMKNVENESKKQSILAFEATKDLKEAELRLENVKQTFAKFKSEKEKEENEMKKKMEDRECPICIDREAAVLFLPCKHLGACRECNKDVSVCPLCRVKIEKRWKIFG